MNELKTGRRYTFYEKRTALHSEISYRATFLEIRHIAPKYYYIYLLCNHVNQSIVAISPLEWISKVESMDDILQGKTVLCPDVLSIVDEFL
jgi:hypothetical protein